MLNSGRYFEPLNPITKEQYIEKLLLLNSTGDNGLYSPRTLFTMSPWVWSAVEFEVIFATKSLMALSTLFTFLIHT